jgi:hypothetical protein
MSSMTSTGCFPSRKGKGKTGVDGYRLPIDTQAPLAAGFEPVQNAAVAVRMAIVTHHGVVEDGPAASLGEGFKVPQVVLRYTHAVDDGTASNNRVVRWHGALLYAAPPVLAAAGAGANAGMTS